MIKGNILYDRYVIYYYLQMIYDTKTGKMIKWNETNLIEEP